MKNHIDRKLLLRYLYEDVVKVREEMFQWEITSLYYFNLYFDIESDLRFSHPMRYYSTFEDRKIANPIHEKPKACLNHIFDLDKQQPSIKTWLLYVVDDLHMLTTDIERNLASFTNKH